MNTRGLTELVVLNLGRDLGVLDGPLFTLLVIMAVVTTVATSPLLDIVKPDPWLGEGGVNGGPEG
jgi:Kef-type K+ transport system membrane component KefB